MKTRAQAVRDYLEATGIDATSAQQSVALELFCNDLEHIGFIRGFEQGSQHTTLLFGSRVRA